MEVIAKSKYIRMSPRKVQLVATLIRGLSVSEAKNILNKLNKRATVPLLLTLKQAIGNAVKNFGLSEKSLMIKRLEIGKGPSYKRGRPVSRGQWHTILKRTCHITMVLEGEALREEKVSQVSQKGKTKTRDTHSKLNSRKALKQDGTKS